MTEARARLTRLIPLAHCGPEIDDLLLEGQANPLLGPMSLLDRSTFPTSNGLTPNYAVAWREDRVPWAVLWGAPSHLWPATAHVGLFAARPRTSNGHGLRRAAGLAEAMAVFCRELLAAGFRRVEVEVEAVNAPMLRFLRRIGVRQEGTLRAHSYLGGRLVDTHLFAFDGLELEAVIRANWRRAADWTAAEPPGP